MNRHSPHPDVPESHTKPSSRTISGLIHSRINPESNPLRLFSSRGSGRSGMHGYRLYPRAQIIHLMDKGERTDGQMKSTLSHWRRECKWSRLKAAILTLGKQHRGSGFQPRNVVATCRSHSILAPSPLHNENCRAGWQDATPNRMLTLLLPHHKNCWNPYPRSAIGGILASKYVEKHR